MLVPIQLNADQKLSQDASKIFYRLGFDMNTAFNIFLEKCVTTDDIPFSFTMPKYKQGVLDAMDEAVKLSHDPNTKRYSSFDEALEDMDL